MDVSQSSDTAGSSEYDDSLQDPGFVPCEDSVNTDGYSEDNTNRNATRKEINPTTKSRDQEDTKETESTDAQQSTPPDRTRKRVRRTEHWKKNIRKSLRNSGQAYEDAKGNKHAGKTFKTLENHICRYECSSFTDEERTKLFNEYWRLNSWDLQTSFLSSCMRISAPKRHVTNRVHTNKISISLVVQNKRVCKMFLLKSLDISAKRYENVAKKKRTTGISSVDRRGRHVPTNKMPQDSIDFVKQHIESIPRYTSHYSRHHNPQVKYLSADLNIHKMFTLYCEKCHEENMNPVKEGYYRHIFNTQFNLKFKRPHSDTCAKCDALDNKIKFGEYDDIIIKHKQEKDRHLNDAEKAKSSKEIAKQLAKDNPSSVRSICFDLEKTLPTPLLPTGVVYYLRQLWTYNFGIHDLATDKASMYMWHEGVGNRGSQEVGSCLLFYVKSLPSTVKHLVAFSDNCGGQNKNQNIVRFWMYIVKFTNLEKVDHKFLVSGHSYMECDQDFGLIEKARKNTEYVFVPDDWVNIVSKASRKFSVTRMKKQDFCSISNMQTVLVNTPVKGIREMQWLHFEKDSPAVLFYKRSLDNDLPFENMDLNITRSGRPNTNLELGPLYSDAISIKTAKYKDLQKLLNYLPPIHHDFYKLLVHVSAKNKQQGDDPEEAHSVISFDFDTDD